MNQIGPSVGSGDGSVPFHQLIPVRQFRMSRLNLQRPIAILIKAQCCFRHVARFQRFSPQRFHLGYRANDLIESRTL